MEFLFILAIAGLMLLACLTLCEFLYIRVKRQAESLAQLANSEQEYRKFVENSPNKVVRYDADFVRVYVSPNETGMEVSHDFLLGKKPTEYPGGEPGRIFEQHLRDVFTQKTGKMVNLDSYDKTGKSIVWRVKLLPEFDYAGHVKSVLAFAQDITEVVNSYQRIEHIMFFDQLTNLPNRGLLSNRIQQIIDEQQNQPQTFAVMIMDTHHFKEVNDVLGYALGDQLINEMAKRLKTVVRECDTLARIRGGEFAVLVPNAGTTESLSKMAEKIIDLFSKPFNFAEKEIFVSLSLGVATYPEHSQDTQQLLHYADSAMYDAKKSGRNNVQFYSTELTRQSIARTELDTDLRKALDNAELDLYYQPQIAIGDGHLVGAEALIRWKHPTLGMIAPNHFIPLAEETGLIVEIGDWVLATAFKAATVLNEQAGKSLKIAINLSFRQFIRNDLVATVRRLLLETACQPAWVKLEITESLLLDDSNEVLKMLMEISDMGIEFSIDDFGTGYSALSYLTRYPISQIKIDRSFVMDVPMDLEKSELIKVFVHIAKVLHLDLVAEGIETQEQADYLHRVGCNTAQGYFYYKPMPYNEFEKLVNASRILKVATS